MVTNEEGIRYLRENFQASDWLAVFLQNQGGHIIQRFTTAQRLAESDVQAWLDYKNRQGYKVCVSMNALTPGVESRRKQDVAMIRHLYVDVDQNGPQVLPKIVQSEKTPTPNYVLETSPGKYQVIWKVEGMAKAHAEVLLKGLAQEYGADPAPVDSNRVLRIPGFRNEKYSPAPTVTARKLAEETYHAEEFKVQYDQVKRWALHAEHKHPHAAAGQGTQSHWDFHIAARRLRSGEDPKRIAASIDTYRAQWAAQGAGKEKYAAPWGSDPMGYGERTVRAAMAAVGHERQHSRGLRSENVHQLGPAITQGISG
jgi:hypothetical protein